MKNYQLLILLPFLLSNFSINAQRIEKPDKLKPLDFTKTDRPICVQFQRILVTFPFEENIQSGGATDQQFKLSIESIIRISFKEALKDTSFILLSNIYGSEIKIKSMNYYYLDNNKIINKPFDQSDMVLGKNDSVFYANFSSIIKNPNSIIELNYSLLTSSKENIIFNINKNLPYQNLKINIDIPEIYSYAIIKKNNCLSLKTGRKSGQTMGYKNANSPNATMTGKILAQVFQKNMPGSDYRPVYLMLIPNVYSLSDDCNSLISNADCQILNLKRSLISEQH
jgi:hypothetical protein